MPNDTLPEVDAFLADSVAVAERKLYAQGAGWNRITARSLPAAHDRIGIGLIFHIGPDLSGRHTFEIRLEDDEGRPQSGQGTPGGSPMRVSGEFTVHSMPVGGESLMPLAVNLNGLVFEREGGFRFVVSVDERAVKTIPFRVERAGTETPAPTPTTSSSSGGYL
jgi:hypothetical protein